MNYSVLNTHHVKTATNVTSISESETIDDTDTLIMRAKSGETAAFELLYRQHVRQVYSLCYRMTANIAQSEELTQEAFIRVWQKLELFNGQSAFSTWLYRLVTNVVISQMRRKNLLDPQDDFAALLDKRAGNQSDTGIAMDLEAAILQLLTGARQVFVLHDVEGYKHSEVAAMLEIAEGTSKTQLHRGRKLLREWMT